MTSSEIVDIRNPLVSIVIPSYNHMRFISNCIESLYEQTYSHFELFVFDDGSSDNSKEILIHLQRKYKFYLEFQSNLGLANTLTKGFRDFSKGKYLTFCASDDFWLPDKLEKQVGFMEANPAFAMVFGKTYIIDNNNNIMEKSTENANFGLKGGLIFKELILLDFHPPVNYLFRASVIKKIGFYRPQIWAEDFDMNLKIALDSPIGFLDDFLTCYRVTNRGKEKMLNYKTINSHLESINQFKDSDYFREAIRKWHYRNFIWYCMFKESKIFAIKNMFQSRKYVLKKEYLKSLVYLFVLWK